MIGVASSMPVRQENCEQIVPLSRLFPSRLYLAHTCHTNTASHNARIQTLLNSRPSHTQHTRKLSKQSHSLQFKKRTSSNARVQREGIVRLLILHLTRSATGRRRPPILPAILRVWRDRLRIKWRGLESTTPLIGRPRALERRVSARSNTGWRERAVCSELIVRVHCRAA